ncbi:hypothetical protein MKW92_005483, partial [Papaver armeniacum]
LYFQNGFILKKFNYRSNVKNLGVVNLVVVFFAIICRLLPRSTTTYGGHGHIQRDNSFPAAVEKEEDEDGEELLEKSKEEMEEEVENKKKLLPRSAQQAAVDEDGEDVEVVLERSKEDPEEGVVEKKKELLPRSARQAEVEDDKDEDGEEVEVVPEKSTEEPEENEEEEVEAEENEENGPRPHRCMTKREHHHQIQLHHYHRLCNRYHQIPMNQQQFGLENGGRNSCSFPDPREESFPAPEERIFNYNQVNRYPFHRPYPSAPPIPESSYYTQINSNPRTIPRADASSSPSQQTESQTLQSRKDPLPLPPPRRRKEREERRISTQSKTAKKGESGRFRFQFVIPPATIPIQPPQPSQSSVAQSSSPLLPAPPLPAQSFLTKLFKPNDNQKKVNLNSSLSPPPSLASPSFPPTSSVHQFFKKSSKTKKIISDVGLPPPLPPQPPPPRPSPEPPPPKKTSAQPPVPPHGSCKLHKNTRPSSLMPQNQTVPAPKDTNQGTPPRTMTNTLRRKRQQDTDGHLKKEIYVEIGYQSPLNGIAQPPPPLPFPNRGMKFVAHGDLVNIQSSSSDSIDDPLSTPCYCSSSDTNIKAKN